jgi:ABC-type transporter Mla subunit MlaD
MRRIAVIVAVAAAAIVWIVVGAGHPSGSSSAYQVRALFDNAGFAVPGEDVRIAGAPVGTISSLSVTKQNLAAVTLSITNHDFSPWYANATCAIRPQSLIAERYVDCEPGSSNHAQLPKIRNGAGAGTYLLPVSQTSSPIDPDIVQNISQDSVRESLSLILDELGTGLAARGADLNSVILRANPALRQTDQVFQILASQNKVLAKLATDSDTVLRPLAKARHQLADFVVQANKTATATAVKAPQIAQSIQLLPPFMKELKPLMADLGYLANQGTPVMTSLNQSATSLNSEFKNLIPFATQARTALINLGNAAQQSQGYLDQTVPLAHQLLALGNAAAPSSQALDQLTASLNRTGALQQLMGVLFYGAGATNGFDSDGHYVRADALFGACTAYNSQSTPVGGCSSNFGSGSAAAAAAGTTQTAQEVSAQTRAESSLIAELEQTAAAGDTNSSLAGASGSEAAIASAIAREAVQQVSRSPQKSSPALLSGLLRYLLGGGGQ